MNENEKPRWKRAEYRSWRGMKERCHKPTDPAFKWYGARGIEVCERWRASFDAFLADMGPRPSRHHSIDRIDNNLGYEPSNCRWATSTQQNRNRRDVIRFDVRGELLCPAEIEERYGVHTNTFLERVRKNGLTPDEAISVTRLPRTGGGRKLTEEQAKRVIALVASGVPSTKAAELFGINSEQVCRIAAGKCWKHLDRSALSREVSR